MAIDIDWLNDLERARGWIPFLFEPTRYRNLPASTVDRLAIASDAYDNWFS